MNSLLRLSINGREILVSPGSVTTAPLEELFNNAFDTLLAAIHADTISGILWRESANRHLAASHPWLLRILTDRRRTRWLELNPPRPGSWVLDVGSGCGQWSISAAANARVVALEANPVRMSLARAIAAQESCLDSIYFVGASLQDTDFFGKEFDRIYCIGVLEWAGRYRPSMDPIAAQHVFLTQLRGLLSKDGECVIGVENRLGLKYLLGAPDDHTGLSGISCLDAVTAAARYKEKTGQPLRVFTHTLSEYEQLLHKAGFSQIEFFAAYPDYKTPQAILPIADGSANRHCLNGKFIAEHDGSNGTMLLIQEELASHYRSLGALGVAGLFAPSFYIRARQ